MFSFRFNSKVSEAFVSVVVADFNVFVRSDEGCDPAVTMSPVKIVDFLYEQNHLFPVKIPLRLFAAFPFVIAAATDTHHLAKILNIIISG